MSDFNPEIFTKLVVFLGGLVLFIKVFASRIPRDDRPPTRAPLPEDSAIGPYQIEQPIADGGTATVYRGRDGAGQRVALKIPHLEQLKDRNFVRSFLREADIGTTLTHPSIVRVLKTGHYEAAGIKQIPYFAMEYLQGQDLRQILKERESLPALEAAQIARSVADALGWAHHRGVIHRDVSPRNIFVTEQRNVKVMDFGVSTVFSRTDKRLVTRGMNLGTPRYLAPERTNGVENDPRSDLYSLGCIFYEMLSGAPPFPGESPKAVLMMHRKAVPTSLSHSMEVNPQLEAIVMRLLEKDPKKRYQTAAEVTAALADLVPNP